MNGLNGAEWSEWSEWSSIPPLRLDQEASKMLHANCVIYVINAKNAIFDAYAI